MHALLLDLPPVLKSSWKARERPNFPSTESMSGPENFFERAPDLPENHRHHHHPNQLRRRPPKISYSFDPGIIIHIDILIYELCI